jgi:hypothetical protein
MLYPTQKGSPEMTSTAAREDVHRYAVLDPADYTLVALLDEHHEDGSFDIEDDRYDDAEAISEALDGDPGICRLCGQNKGNRYWGFFRHEPSGDVIQVGSVCAHKVGLADRAALEEVRAYEGRRMAQVRAERLFGDPAARSALDWALSVMERLDADLIDPGTHFATDDGLFADGGFPATFAADLLARFNRTARISDKQVRLVDKLRREDAARQAEQARRAAEDAEARPIPADLLGERVQITGQLLATKWQESDFGGAMKMLVRDDRNFKVWGTCPEAISDALVGLATDEDDGLYATTIRRLREAGTPVRVTFAAKVELGQRDPDPTFGFIKRPTKASIVA